MTKPATSELYDVAVPNANMDIIDLAMGDRSCTSSTRPSVAYIGLRVFETDTKAVIVCLSIGPIVWRYVTNPVVASSAAQIALSPKHVGMVSSRSDTFTQDVWDGTNWVDNTNVRVLGGQLATSYNLAGLADIPGCTTGSFSVESSTTCTVTVDFCVSTTPATSEYAEARINVDGANLGYLIQLAQLGNTVAVTNHLTVPVPLTAGVHAIKMQATHSAAATSQVQQFLTRITVTVFGN
jgi:hypothetical protein